MRTYSWRDIDMPIPTPPETLHELLILAINSIGDMGHYHHDDETCYVCIASAVLSIPCEREHLYEFLEEMERLRHELAMEEL